MYRATAMPAGLDIPTPQNIEHRSMNRLMEIIKNEIRDDETNKKVNELYELYSKKGANFHQFCKAIYPIVPEQKRSKVMQIIDQIDRQYASSGVNGGYLANEMQDEDLSLFQPNQYQYNESYVANIPNLD
jgi:hypothetical protein